MIEAFWSNIELLWPSSWLGRSFIITMGVIFFYALYKVSVLNDRAKKNIQQIQAILEGQTTDSLYENIGDIRDKAKNSKNPVIQSLWHEFDESLVLDHREKGVFNTLDAEHFFNPRTLASGITSSRLLAATPSFLTAIGVLGTFIGLTMGLKGLHIESDEIDALKGGIASMINGAALAFVTSVWGVALSLVLNVFEKNTERRIIQKVIKLQQRIDFLYPRLPAEKSLVDISKNTSDSSDALKELHERIGDRLQETISGVSDSMQEAFTNALNNVMAPAMQSLVSNTSQQTNGVIEQLIGNFTESMQSAGRGQGELMQKSTEEMRQAVGILSEQMNKVVEQTSTNNQTMVKQQEEASQQFNEQIRSMLSQSEERQQSMESQFSESLNTQQQAMSEREVEHRNRLQTQLDSWLEQQSQLIITMTDAVQKTQSHMDSVITQHREVVGELKSVAEATAKSSQNLNNSSNQIAILSANLVKATELFDTRLVEMTDSIKGISAQNDTLANHVLVQAKELQNLETSLSSTVDKFGETAQLARSSFSEMKNHQTEFITNIQSSFESLGGHLTKQVSDIEKQTNEWLRSYSSEVNTQVVERMEVWNNNTLEFANQMQRTVSTISELVDELERN
jgi:3-methyladenine DNA glycosylase AlkC